MYIDLQCSAAAHQCQWCGTVSAFILNVVLKLHIGVIGKPHKALVVRRRIADAGDDVPRLERVASVRRYGPLHHHAPHATVDSRKAARSKCLQVVKQGRLAVVIAVSDIA